MEKIAAITSHIVKKPARVIAAKLREKKGDSHLVAVVLVICVTIALCALFKDQLITLFTNTVFPSLKDAAQKFMSY
jgi:hypothetical protein